METLLNMLGGRSASNQEPTPGQRGDQYRTQLAQTNRTQELKIAKLEKDASVAREKAKASVKAGKRQEAAILLKRAALIENQIKVLWSFNTNNAIMASQVESTQMTTENMKLLKEGSEYQKSLMAEMGDVEDIKELKDDIVDIMEQGQEIIQMASEPFDLGGIIPDLDDEALERAMDDLEAEADAEIEFDLKDQLNDISIPTASPSPSPTISSPSPSTATATSKRKKKNRYAAVALLDE